MVVSHCAKEVKPIAIMVRDGQKKGTFTTVEAFLIAFRWERYPSFDQECQLAYGKMSQRFKETAMAFYFRFKYILNAMNRDPEQYREDYLKKLMFPRVVEKVRYRKTGLSLSDLAQLTNDIESEMGVRDKAKDWGNDDDDGCDNDIQQLSAGGNRGGRSSRGGRGSGKGRNGARGGRGGSRGKGGRNSSSTSLQDHFLRLDKWNVSGNDCWNCFKQVDDMEKHKKECSSPCLFCKNKSHRSVYCEKAPDSKDGFEAVVKKGQKVSSV